MAAADVPPAYLTCLGVSNVAPWLAYISAIDYLDTTLPAARLGFTLPVANLSALLLVTLVLVVCSVQPPHGALVPVLGVQAVCVAAVPLLDAVLPPAVAAAAIVLSVCICAATSAVSQAVVYSLAAALGSTRRGWPYPAAVELGKGLAGFVIIFVRIGTKLAVSPAEADFAPAERRSALVFFACACGAQLGACAAARALLARLPRDGGVEGGDGGARGGAGSPLLQPPKPAPPPPAELGVVPSRMRTTALAVSDLGAALVLIFAVCLACFPGVASAFPPRAAALKGWMAVALVLCFNAGDLVGKALPACVELFDRRSLWLGVCAHSLFVPLCCARARPPAALPAWAASDAAAFVLIGALGLSTGYLSTAAVVLLPRAAPGGTQAARELAGQVGVLFLVLGLCLGALGGLGLSRALGLGPAG